MNKFSDNRGTLIFPIKENSFNFGQCTVSINKKNVFRGLHMNNFDKLVSCIQGSVLDIIVDLNEHSPEYLIPKYFFLKETQILVPSGFAHGFLSLEDNSILVYHFNGVFTDENTKHIHYRDPFIRIPSLISLPDRYIEIKDPILSEKDSIRNFIKPIDYLIFGYKGFIGSFIVENLKDKSFITSDLRLENVQEIKELLEFYKPKYIINCAGITGRPNIFWCEDHKTETIESNLTYQLTLAHLCSKLGIHLTVLGSGGIFLNDKEYSESETGNFKDNYYSQLRIELESLISKYAVLYLRINFPISSRSSPKNLITKLISYNKIDHAYISITCLDNMIPILINMIESGETGITNFTNPGFISLVEIKNLLNKFYYKDFEVNKNLDQKRVTSLLKAEKILKYNPLYIEDALKECVKEYFRVN